MTAPRLAPSLLALAAAAIVAACGAEGGRSDYADGDSGQASPATVIDTSATRGAPDSTAGVSERTFTYAEQAIGYREFELLNKTDRKWIVEAWREPAAHSSAQEFHASFWNAAVRAYGIRESARRAAFERKIQELLGE